MNFDCIYVYIKGLAYKANETCNEEASKTI